MDIVVSGMFSAQQASAVNKIYSQSSRNDNSSVDNDNKQDTDSLQISEESQKLFSIASLFDTKPGEPITLEDIQSFADKQLEEFNSEFRALMRSNNIDTSVPVKLGHEYGSGRVIVKGDHPDAEKIEALFDNNFDLRNKYTGITNALEILKHGREHIKFSEAYEKNPEMAAAQYSYLFNMRWEAQISFTDEGYSVSYDQTERT